MYVKVYARKSEKKNVAGDTVETVSTKFCDGKLHVEVVEQNTPDQWVVSYHHRDACDGTCETLEAKWEEAHYDLVHFMYFRVW